MASAELLKKVAVKEEKKSDKALTIPVSGVTQELIDRFLKAKAELKSKEATVQALGMEIVSIAEPERIAESKRVGDVISSLKMGGGTYVTYQPTNQYITDEAKAGLEEDGLGFYAEDVYSIDVDVTKISDKQLEDLQAAGAVVVRKNRLLPDYYRDVSLGRIALSKFAKFVAFFRG